MIANRYGNTNVKIECSNSILEESYIERINELTKENVELKAKVAKYTELLISLHYLPKDKLNNFFLEVE